MAVRAARLSTLTAQFRQWLDGHLWKSDLSESSVGQRFCTRTLQIAYAIIRDLLEGQLSLRAMSLVYYTVIAFIPLLALTFSVLKGLGAHNAMEPALLNLLAPLGERSTEVTRNIINFVENVRVDVLSFLSLGVLVYSVLTMMQKVEMAFNFIWNISEGRSFANRISEYLFAVIVSPLLIFLSVGISSYIRTNIFAHYLESLSFGGTILQVTGYITAFGFMSLAFAFAYSFIPNTRVKFGSALIGGIMTTLIWKTMGEIFQSFFVNSTSSEIIYLAFFTVILIMIFIYLGWLVLLIGSSIAYYHQNPSKARTGRRKTHLSIAEQEEYTLIVVFLIVEHFQHKEEPWSSEELAQHIHVNQAIVDEIVSLLCHIDFIRPTNESPQKYLPSVTVEDCTVKNILQRIRHYSPDTFGGNHNSVARSVIEGFLNEADELFDSRLGSVKFIDLMDDGLTVKKDHSDATDARKQ